ncbi:hypothetical protein Tco_1395912 [Tanacetum coccineum]
MVINSPCLIDKKELAIPGQMATGKEFSNPLMADSLPKTILPTKLVGCLEENPRSLEFKQTSGGSGGGRGDDGLS